MLFPFETSMPTAFIVIPPILNYATGIHLFLIADSIYWVTRTLRLNLLKPNATTRGWLTVFCADMEIQEMCGRPVAPLIVA